MNHFEQHSHFYNGAIRLTEEEKANPLEAFETFFRICNLPQARKTLVDIVENALTADCSIFDKADERHHLLWFYHSMETMLEAAYLLCQQAHQKKIQKIIQKQRKKARQKSKKSKRHSTKRMAVRPSKQTPV